MSSATPEPEDIEAFLRDVLQLPIAGHNEDGEVVFELPTPEALEQILSMPPEEMQRRIAQIEAELQHRRDRRDAELN